MSEQPKIIAIAGPVGSGKTTLVNGLSSLLGDAIKLHFDHYEKLTDKPVCSVNEEELFNDFNLPELVNDLDKLKRRESIIDPINGEVVESCRYVVIEMPMGRNVRDAGELIDILIWLDIPLDIALARKIKEFTQRVQRAKENEAASFVEWLSGYLNNYIVGTHGLLLAQKKWVAPNADVGLDAMVDRENLLQQAHAAIQNKI